MARIWKSLAAIALCAGVAPVWAADCAVEIEGNDAMQFNKSTIAVPANCKQFTVKLKHVGKLPKAAMGHNWVLSKAADQQGVVTDGIAAGAAKEYVAAGDKRCWPTPRWWAAARPMR